MHGKIRKNKHERSRVRYANARTKTTHRQAVHWAWHADGWASPYRETGEGLPLLAGCGAADFAGSAVVHMVGGVAALVAAVAVKPRRGRFGRNGQPQRLPQQSPALQTLGTLILWVGWCECFFCFLLFVFVVVVVVDGDDGCHGCFRGPVKCCRSSVAGGRR